MTIERHPFTDTGINSLDTGVALFQALGLSPDRLAVDPASVSKMNIIAEFLNTEPDPVFTIQKVASSNQSPNIQTIDHFVNFVNLETSRRGHVAEAEKIKEEIDNHYA